MVHWCVCVCVCVCVGADSLTLSLSVECRTCRRGMKVTPSEIGGSTEPFLPKLCLIISIGRIGGYRHKATHMDDSVRFNPPGKGSRP